MTYLATYNKEARHAKANRAISFICTAHIDVLLTCSRAKTPRQ